MLVSVRSKLTISTTSQLHRRLLTTSCAVNMARSSAASPNIRTTTPSWHEWRMNPPTATPVDSTTFRNQAQLPRLPVPALDDTLSKLVKSCEPLAKDSQELQTLKDKVEQFKADKGIGRELQRRLEAKREQE